MFATLAVVPISSFSTFPILFISIIHRNNILISTATTALFSISLCFCKGYTFPGDLSLCGLYLCGWSILDLLILLHLLCPWGQVYCNVLDSPGIFSGQPWLISLHHAHIYIYIFIYLFMVADSVKLTSSRAYITHIRQTNYSRLHITMCPG